MLKGYSFHHRLKGIEDDVHNLKEKINRFEIIDKDIVYHIGASLKDLGKKWFAFSRIDFNANELIEKLAH